MNSVRSLTQAYSQAPWRKQVKLIVLSLLLVVFVALVAGVYLSVTARAATIGREILLMQVDIDEIELEIADLNNQLAVITSSTEMEKRARELGFEPIELDQSFYLVVPGYTPREMARLAPPPSPATPVTSAMPEGYDESLVDWLRQRILTAGSILEEQR